MVKQKDLMNRRIINFIYRVLKPSMLRFFLSTLDILQQG